MSIKVMTLVWDAETYKGHHLNVLLKMADHGWHDGTHIFPSQERLARKCQISVRTVQRVQAELERAGVLILDQDGRGRGRTKHYRINIRRLEELKRGSIARAAETKEKTTDRRVPTEDGNTTAAAENTIEWSQKRDTAVAQTVNIEPSESLDFPPVALEGLHPPTNTNTRGKRLPDDWTLPGEWRQWAFDKGYALKLDLDHEAAKFRDYWIAQPGKRGVKRHWFATFRNWIRRACEDSYNGRNRKNSNAGNQTMLRAAAAVAERQALGRTYDSGDD